MKTVKKTAGANVKSATAPTTALAVMLPQHITFDGRSLSFEKGTTLEEWKAVGQSVANASKISQWILGDWLNFGQGAFKKEYKAAAEATGLAYGTLRTAARIAKRFPASLRRIGDKITFEHHRLMAVVKDDKQTAALQDRIEKEGLSAKATQEVVETMVEKKALTPEQVEARDIAESTRLQEQAQHIIDYLSNLPQAKEKRLAMWGKLLHAMKALDYSRLIKIADRENKSAADVNPTGQGEGAAK